MSDPTSSVRLRSVTKNFRSGTVGIDDVTIDIEGGEFVTFLGPSGSGKTTTLNTIAGFLRPTTGQVEIGGQDVTALPPRRRNLGMVFQNYALFPHMTVRENVAFGLHRRGLSKEQTAGRIDDALSMVRLDRFGDSMPKQLSGGQQQRVALARALVYRPPVLLMDEPLAALDKALRTEMQVEIGRIHREVGTTFLFVTHDQDEALGLSDRIALFNHGKVVQMGTPTELYERPQSLFTAEFLGESNVFRGVVADDGVLKFADQVLRFPAASGSSPAGTRAAMVVRPERMRLCANGEGGAAENHVPAVITEIAYFGSFRRITVSYPDGGTGLLRGGVESPAPFSPGDTVTVSWDPAHSVVVPDSAPAA
ncbi:putative spermidine/putrescine transport system ATP-binding protein [Mycobacterium frederiksbergense]|uniref:Spermidine/putrescine transport system ATP-binding protein n=1 Tax=Mycolicibacterium frederiksbergense TaxID=117567 RepID=A0ABT6KX35_9MYCO|nr:ABC transporter ATP-binding protein [Mycolicibacterium frederiksbergense]MDH6195261.1 putative spermidine/putrescine transport system ATP-binding protein [Mycolicibacterium frederiksbergense]